MRCVDFNALMQAIGRIWDAILRFTQPSVPPTQGAGCGAVRRGAALHFSSVARSRTVVRRDVLIQVSFPALCP
jgi:hypothetical protein